VRFAYGTRMKTHVLCDSKTSPEIVIYNAFPLGHDVYGLDSICFIYCPSNPPNFHATSNGRGTHGFVPTTGQFTGVLIKFLIKTFHIFFLINSSFLLECRSISLFNQRPTSPRQQLLWSLLRA
jgi:hypothetical protein